MMTKFFSMTTTKAVLLTSATLVGASLAPGAAQAGFFESLFGGGAPAPQAAPSLTYDAPAGAPADVSAPRVIHRPRKHVVQDDKPVLQKTTDIWHDKTLRDGDAVMMKDGLHVFTGSHGSKLIARDLPRFNNADLSKKERSMLMAMDVTSNETLATGAAPDTVASGRSAAVASSIVPGYKITDTRGNSVRYVGP